MLMVKVRLILRNRSIAIKAAEFTGYYIGKEEHIVSATLTNQENNRAR
jgi:hypothetical protein